MKVLKLFFVLIFAAVTYEMAGQDLPTSYQTMLNEISVFFETIRGANTVSHGSTTLGYKDNKIAMRLEHNKSVKNLTFEMQSDEENQMRWVAANELTIDMVNKYEDFVAKELKSMHKAAEKKSKE